MALNLYSGLAILLAYVLLGVLGLTMAIPPGYASPIFPAAGLALAVVLHFGRRALIPVGMGSFLLNLGHAIYAEHLHVATVFAFLGIALGASLQAAMGSWLVQRKMGSTWQYLEAERRVTFFLLLGGVLACFISASIAIFSLGIAQIIDKESLTLSWWTWYTGDLLGVVIFAPLALLFLNRQDDDLLKRRRKIAIPILMAFGLSVGLYLGASIFERRDLHEKIGEDGKALKHLIQNRLNVHSAVLASLAHFVEAKPDFSYPEFEHFTQAFLSENPDLFALSFNDVVLRENLKEYEKEISRHSPLGEFRAMERNDEMKLVPVGEREKYVLVRYIVPLEGNRPAVGFDIHSEQFRREAIERSRLSGGVAVTAPIRLVQENRARTGVLVLHPAYGSIYGSKEMRWKLFGYAVAVIKVDELIGIATQGQIPKGLFFKVHDRKVEDPALNFYVSEGRPKVPDYRRWQSELSIGDRQWDLEIFAGDLYVNQKKYWGSWFLGVIALLFTGLLQIYLHGITGRDLQIRRQNHDLLEEHSQLLFERAAFENAAESMVVTDLMGNVISINPAFTQMTGYTLDDIQGKNMSTLSSGAHDQDFYKKLWDALLNQRKWQGEITNRRKNGELYKEALSITAARNPQGFVTQYVGTFSEIQNPRS